MRKNAEKMDLSSRNQLLQVPAGSHGFWAHDPLPYPSHDLDVDPQRVTIPDIHYLRAHFSLKMTLLSAICVLCELVILFPHYY